MHMLQEESLVSDPLEKTPLLSVLKVVRKIRVPEKLVWQSWEIVAPLHSIPVKETDINMTELKTDGDTPEVKLTVPDIKFRANMSGSPRSQRLSNMITGSNTASKEDLGSENEKKDANVLVVFTGEDQEQDPGSPNSVTPFIMPSSFDSCQPNSDGLVSNPIDLISSQ